MSRNKIIVGGCSFTDKNYPKFAKPKPLDFKMWPEHIGSMLNKEVINTARCGYGNQAIYHQTLKAIMNNRVDHVFVMWTCWIRQDFLISDIDERDYMTLDLGWDKRYDRSVRFDHDEWYDNSFNKNWLLANDKGFVAKQPTMKQIIDTNMNYIYSMQTICENLNIGYTACSSCSSRIDPFVLIKHPYEEKIKNFIGWPMLKEIGGWDFDRSLKEKYGHDYINVSSCDFHPNEKAHKIIAHKIMEHMNV